MTKNKPAEWDWNETHTGRSVQDELLHQEDIRHPGEHFETDKKQLLTGSFAMDDRATAVAIYRDAF
jgi:hypothetical protein